MNLGPERPSDSLSRDRFHPAVLIATGCGIGYLPIAPGTWASLISLPLAWLIAQNFGQVGLAAATLGALIVGIWASGTIERLRGEKDPSSVVIDEIAGQWVCPHCRYPQIYSSMGQVLYFFELPIFSNPGRYRGPKVCRVDLVL